jgi:hypothetical protein
MRRVSLPADSKRYSEMAFRQKERYHQRRRRMSFARKLAVLDTLLEARKNMPRFIPTKSRGSELPPPRAFPGPSLQGLGD